MKIDMADASRVKAAIVALGGDLKKAAENAQNKMIFTIFKAENDQMKINIDRPTPWSLGALRYKKVGAATPDQPNIDGAAAYMANAFAPGTFVGQSEWLGVQIMGGQTAGPRRSERALQSRGWMPANKVWVPAVGAPLDAYGNVKGWMISQMLADLGANPRGGKAKAGKTAKYILIGDPGNEEGVFRKVGAQWVPFLWFVDRAQYTARYSFFGRSETEIAAKYPGYVDEYLQKALDRLR